jgi:hypothetical protein
LVDPETGAVVLPQGASLEAQVLHPLLDPVEMSRSGRPWAELRHRLATVRPLALAADLPPDVQASLANHAGYPGLFAAAFGDATITLPRLAMAIATYLRTLVPDQTPWDRHARGQAGALTPNQLAGLALFENEARCHICHPPGLFTDRAYRGLGLVPVAQDPGRGAVTGQAGDYGAFKVPGLRNVGLKTTFMHNGRFTSLTQVVGFYRNGGGTAGPRDPEVAPLSLDQVQTQHLLDFVTDGLTDPRVRDALPPFDRPTLWSERHAVGANLFGAATPWSGGTPRLLAHWPTAVAAAEWRVGCTDGPPTAPSFLVLGFQRAAAGALLAGMPMHVDLGGFHAAVPSALDATGLGSWLLPVPALPPLRGLPLFAQVVLVAPGGSFSATGGASWVVQ